MRHAPLEALSDIDTAGDVFATADGERLFYRDVGTGRPVVFIHGWTLSSEIWRGQLDWLAGQGLRAVAYDRRGHGRSSRPAAGAAGYDYDSLASDLAALLDSLDLEDVVLVGHSMGAGEVVRYLARHGDDRISRVMLVAPTTPYNLKTADNPEGIDRSVYDGMTAALQADLRGFLSAGMPGFLGSNPECALVDWAISIALQAALPAQIGCMRAFAETDLRAETRAVRLPTLIVYGSADTPNIIASSQRSHAAIAGSRLDVYDGAPHGLFLTHRERFNRDLLAFARG
ncbi:MAG: alpha/beta hydrolase [Proteobacteria bacterium]|nr:alpha/beta hydrolase [Pseudomonadota bacterium]